MENHSTFQESLVRVGGWAKVRPSDMIMLKAEVNYTKIFTNDGNNFLVALPLKELEKRLVPFEFYRPHKSFLVNLNYVLNFSENDEETFINMQNDVKINVSRRKRVDLLKSGSLKKEDICKINQ